MTDVCTTDAADPGDDVRDRAVFASADVEQVAGVQDLLPLFEARGEFDAVDGDVFVAAFERGVDFRLLADAGAHVDAEALVVDKGGEVAAVDAAAVVAGAAMLPGPVLRRVPIGDVVVLVFVADEARADGDHALLLPGERPLGEAGERGVAALLGAPGAEAVARFLGVPVFVGRRRLAVGVAALGVFEVADEVFAQVGEVEVIGRMVFVVLGFAGEERAGQEGRGGGGGEGSEGLAAGGEGGHGRALAKTGVKALEFVLGSIGCGIRGKGEGGRWKGVGHLRYSCGDDDLI